MGLFRRKNGQATLEGIMVVVFVLTALFIFQKYILRAFSGRWRQTGETFSYGRQFDPEKTIECRFYENADRSIQIWYEAGCFETHCRDICFEEKMSSDACQNCISGHSCLTPQCQD